MLYPFKARYFSPLGYDDLVVVLADSGTDYLDKDPKIAYDVWKHKIKKANENGNAQ